MLHDAQLDYYGNHLATCSSDNTAKIFKVENSNQQQQQQQNQKLIANLTGHKGPVWQVAWSHPKFGNLLATCSYDSTVFIWKDPGNNGKWVKIKEHCAHSASVNSISWAPHEFGLILVCGSSDGNISVLSIKEDNEWVSSVIQNAHQIGCNSVSWAPSNIPGSLVNTSGGNVSDTMEKRFVSGGCDNLIKIWKFDDASSSWITEHTLDGHSDWVRDVAWAPSVGLSQSYIASCSQDKSVVIWVQSSSTSPWQKNDLTKELFGDVVWRCSWSPSGNILAVSSGDNKVSLWKEGIEGSWQKVGDVSDNN
ncbi:GTPase-activating protein S13 [Clydaea vesicula]|uniref:GTPase-activating protein S13 n=1 Tax=Clydaea vesicula TaxID=447962 RepID=A0AAD5XRH9_9FUNG|nr:GTPase-activating protein S13 [Clydaea vesicula]KAJ3378527.1 GTPase-activating protein S13 [Lobulomyces angularis]